MKKQKHVKSAEHVYNTKKLHDQILKEQLHYSHGLSTLYLPR